MLSGFNFSTKSDWKTAMHTRDMNQCFYEDLKEFPLKKVDGQRENFDIISQYIS